MRLRKRIWALALPAAMAAGCLSQPNPEYGRGSSGSSTTTTTTADTTTTTTTSTSGSSTGTTGSSGGGASTGCDTDCLQPGDVVAQVYEGDEAGTEQFFAMSIVIVGSERFLIASGRDSNADWFPVVAYDETLQETGRVEVVPPGPEAYDGARAWATVSSSTEVHLAGTLFVPGANIPFVQTLAVTPQGVPSIAGQNFAESGLNGRPEAIVRRAVGGNDQLVTVGWTTGSVREAFVVALRESNLNTDYEMPHDPMGESVEFLTIAAADNELYIGGLIEGGPYLGSFETDVGFVELPQFVPLDPIGSVQTVEAAPDGRLLVGGWVGADRGGFLTLIETDGTSVWNADWAEAATSEIEAIDFDGAGNIVVAGFWQDEDESAVAPMVVKLAPDGSELWTRIYLEDFPLEAKFREVVVRDDAIFVAGEAADNGGFFDGLVARLAP